MTKQTKWTQRLGITALIIAGLIGLNSVSEVKATGARSNAVITVHDSTATKVLDMGQNVASPPAHWNSPSFDDSSWQPATQVPAAVWSCASGNWASSATGDTGIWGDNQSDTYLFRQSFMLPTAANYAGSILAFNANILEGWRGAGYVFVDGQQVDELDEGSISKRYAIGQYLKAGKNVVAIAAQSAGRTMANTDCSALDFMITARASGVATMPSSSPTPTNRQVIPRYPTNNGGVPANSKVLFGWKSFHHATSYAFHIWLVGLSGSGSLTSTTPFSFSASIYHKTSYTWDDHGFLPGTYQYSLLPLDDQGHNLAGWSTPTQITIAGSS